jgi:hypothetical protein
MYIAMGGWLSCTDMYIAMDGGLFRTTVYIAMDGGLFRTAVQASQACAGGVWVAIACGILLQTLISVFASDIMACQYAGPPCTGPP